MRSCDRAIVHLLALSDASKTIHGMRAVENWHFLRKGEKRRGKRKGERKGEERGDRELSNGVPHAQNGQVGAEWWRWEYRGSEPPRRAFFSNIY